MVRAFIERHGVTKCPPGPAAGVSKWEYAGTGAVCDEIAWMTPAGDAPAGDAKLAMAKILTMLQDLGGRIHGRNLSRNREQNIRRIRDEARRWFFGRSDFEDWCDTSGFDPGYIRAKAKEVYENGLPKWRAAPGTGARYSERKAYRERTGR